MFVEDDEAKMSVTWLDKLNETAQTVSIMAETVAAAVANSGMTCPAMLRSFTYASFASISGKTDVSEK